MSKPVGERDVQAALQEALAQRGVNGADLGGHSGRVAMRGMADAANQALGHGQGLGHA